MWCAEIWHRATPQLSSIPHTAHSIRNKLRETASEKNTHTTAEENCSKAVLHLLELRVSQLFQVSSAPRVILLYRRARDCDDSLFLS